MSWEQRNEAFSKAQTDAQMAYIEAEREVRSLQAENDKLRELVRQMAYAISPTSREHMLANLAEQGIEVDG